ncbi:MAG: amidohydrolase family protein, partial [Chloroflexi bacterium]|nr:amidohydrolase family protein [Chloroflexota bacterium]
FINAHSHGTGTTAFQKGSLDDTLETWKWDVARLGGSMPYVDHYYDTLWTAIRLLENGVTTTMHNHDLIDSSNYYTEFQTTICAYRDLGIRLAFAPMLADRNIFVYGDNNEFVQSLPAPTRALAEALARGICRFGEKEYFQAIDSLRLEFTSDRITILHGPLSPQWVGDEALQEIRDHARRERMSIHIHVLQTQLQKMYGLKTHGKSLLAHLADLDFLGPNVTCGHCVWVTAEDISILRASGTSVTHHPTCNLRVRNGIAPVAAMLESGVNVAIGMDDKEIGDDKDYIEELRVASKLHRLTSHRLDSKHLLPSDCFKMGTENGATALGMQDRIGTLAKGKEADVVLFRLTRMCEPFLNEGQSPIDLLIYRGRGIDVDTVLVGGEILLRGGRLARIDRSDVVHRLGESLQRHFHAYPASLKGEFAQLRQAIAAYHSPWFDAIERLPLQPYYVMNSRT